MDALDFYRKQDQKGSLFTLLCTLFATLLVLSNVTLKVIYIPWFPKLTLTSGILTYPLTFLITDLVSEIYGEKKAKLMIFIAFCMNLLMVAFTQTTLALPGHAEWVAPFNRFGYTSVNHYQTAFESVFSISGMIFIGSMAAYLIGQMLDVKLFLLLKKKTQGKHLWLRNNVSTCASQLIDTFIMNGIVLIWGLKLSWSTCAIIMLSEYLYKVVFALLDTPLIYILTYWIKKRFTPHESYLQAA